jgi:hypothetical protein
MHVHLQSHVVSPTLRGTGDHLIKSDGEDLFDMQLALLQIKTLSIHSLMG